MGTHTPPHDLGSTAACVRGSLKSPLGTQMLSSASTFQELQIAQTQSRFTQYLWHLLADSAHCSRRPCKAKVPFLTVHLVSFLIVLHVPAPTFTERS